MPVSSYPIAGMKRRLTERQREICLLAALGKSNKEIARDLGIVEDTVKVHLRASYALLNIAGRTDLLTVFPPDGEPSEISPERVARSTTDQAVVKLIAQGEENAGIAMITGLSINAIKNAVREMLKRAKVRNRTELARWWIVNAKQFQKMKEHA